MKKLLLGLALFSSLTYASAIIQDGSVTTAKIANNAVTQAKRAALGQQISSSSGTFSTTATTPTSVTNLSVTITTTGRPVMIFIMGDSSGGTAYIGALATGNPGITSVGSTFYVMRGASAIATYYLYSSLKFAYNSEIEVPPSTVSYMDVVAAGTYTYSIQVAGITGTTTNAKQLVLVAYEL